MKSSLTPGRTGSLCLTGGWFQLPADSKRVLHHFQRYPNRQFYTLRDIYKDMNMKSVQAENAILPLVKRNYCRMDKNNHIDVNPQVFTLVD